MNSFKVDPKSWHYHFAVDYASIYHYDLEQGNVDFCKYTRNVAGGLLLLLLGAVLVLVLSIPPVFLLTWVTACVTNSSLLPLIGVEYLGMFEIVCGLFGFYMYKTQDARDKRKRLRSYKSSKEPGFISQAYHSFKNKYCFQCELTTQNNDTSIQDTKWPRQ